MKLLIHDINMLGDTLMSSPVYKAFKDAGHEVHSLGSPYQRELLEGNPYIDKIWTPKNQWTIIPQLRAEKYQYVLQLNTSFKTNLFLSLLGSTSIAFSYKWKGLPLDIKIKTRYPSCTHGNRIEEIGELIFRAFGLNIEPKMIFESYDCSPRDTIFLCPCSARHRNLRQWSIFKWAILADWLIQRGENPVFIGSEKNIPYLESIIELMNECGSYSVGGSMRLLATDFRRAKLLITVNSFPLHLSISQGTPTLGLIGRTPVEVIVHPSVTNFWYLQDPAIFDHSLKPMQFTVEEVLEKVKEALNEK